MLKKIYFKIFGRYDIRNLIKREIEDGWSVLDAGCGRTGGFEKIQKGAYKVGLDHYQPYLEERRKLSTHDKLVLGDVRNLPFPDNSFDCAVSIEVLEHLTKKDGLKMISELERVARKKVILAMPNGFLATYAGPDDNPDETHLSGWAPDELKKLGFKVFGLSGWKNLWAVKNGLAVKRLKIPILSRFLIDISQFFVYYYPKLAFQLFCIKNLKKHV